MVSVTAPYYLRTFAFGGCKLMLDICLADSRILSGFFRISNFKKRKDFFVSYDNLVLLGVIS